MNRNLIFIPLLLILFACTNTKKYEKISGEWECTRWINKQTGTDKCDDNVYFKFTMDKSYVSELGISKDSGVYRIVDDVLYVTPEGKDEFGVKLTRLGEDTVEFLMNRSGVMETLTLAKKK